MSFNSRETVFWYVWKIGGDKPEQRHLSCIEAREEAERLAIKHPFEKFLVLKADSMYETQLTVRTIFE